MGAALSSEAKASGKLMHAGEQKQHLQYSQEKHEVAIRVIRSRGFFDTLDFWADGVGICQSGGGLGL